MWSSEQEEKAGANAPHQNWTRFARNSPGMCRSAGSEILGKKEVSGSIPDVGARASLQDWAAPLGACCAAGAPVGDPVTATDSQGHKITYDILQDTALQSTDGQAEFTIDASTGQIRVAEGTSLNRADAEQHRVQVEASHTQPGHSDDRIVNAIITVVIDVFAADGSPTGGNNPPGFGGSPGDPGTVREMAENAPGGTLVGAPVTATDADGDALTYALSGASALVIDAATGQIRVADGATLDYETTTPYSVTVTVTDGKDAAGEVDPSIDATLDVTINVLDQLPPAKPDAPAVEQSDDEPSSVLDVTWTAPANDGRPAITDYDLRYRA